MTIEQTIMCFRNDLRELAQQYYETFCPLIIPRFPWVLVYVLPKEQKVRGLWIPDLDGQKKTHKATLDAIVLRVWGNGRHESHFLEDGKELTRVITSELEVGDHVLLPHWAGWPIDPNLKIDFRLVKEESTETSQHFPGGDCIFAKVQHDADWGYKRIFDAIEPILREWQTSTDIPHL